MIRHPFRFWWRRLGWITYGRDNYSVFFCKRTVLYKHRHVCISIPAFSNDFSVLYLSTCVRDNGTHQAIIAFIKNTEVVCCSVYDCLVHPECYIFVGMNSKHFDGNGREITQRALASNFQWVRAFVLLYSRDNRGYNSWSDGRKC
jgi:hypothetical protein